MGAAAGTARKQASKGASKRTAKAPRDGTVVRLAALKPDPKNRRLHNDRNIEMIATALKDVGPARSIVIDERMVVHAGNGVIKAAELAGKDRVRIVDADGDEIIAVRRRNLTPEQWRALAMFDNRAAELATWNYGQLRADAERGLDLTPWFSDAEQHAFLKTKIRAGHTDPDAIPQPRETKIKPGDLFALGEHRLLCGDSTRREDVERVMAGGRAGLSFTSPPYSDQRTYTDDAKDLSPAHLARFLQAAEPFVDYFAVNLGIVRREGAIIRYWDTYISAAEAAGLVLLSWNIWSREGMPMSIGQATAMFPIQHEFIFVFGRRPLDLKPTVPNKSAGQTGRSTNRDKDGSLSEPKSVTIREFRELGTVVSVKPVQDNADHPAQFPVELPRLYVEAFPGDVYEPFGGAGTAMMACEQLGRRCRSIEIAPSYCQVAIDRWQAFTGQEAEKIK